MDTGEKSVAASPKPGWGERLRRMEKLVPVFAVGLVSITAVATALMVARPQAPDPALEQADASAGPKGVVQAPPLKTPAELAAQDQRKTRARPATGGQRIERRPGLPQLRRRRDGRGCARLCRAACERLPDAHPDG